MSLEVVTVMHPKKVPSEASSPREELVRRVGSSGTFEKSPRLRAFFLHVCRCAIEDKPEETTEQQIGIYVYGRPPGYNPNEDNIVRSQARMLRMKLEHHFATDGKHEPVIITIPKGQYLPIFETRREEPLLRPPVTVAAEVQNGRPWIWGLIAAAVLLSIAAVWFGYRLLESRHSSLNTAAGPVPPYSQPEPNDSVPEKNSRPVVADDAGAIRIAAGHSGAPLIDASRRRWEADRYYAGGVIQPAPRHFFPPVADDGVFRSMREALSVDPMVPQSERGFQYNIPAPPGVYELRLYFADPLRQPDSDQTEDAQNDRHFQVALNGRLILPDLDPVADAGSAPVDVRVFKDVRPGADGKIHLNFSSEWGDRAFVTAVELTPGTAGRLKPIRIAAGRRTDLIDADGNRWSADNSFIDGRTWLLQNAPNGPKIPALYLGERHGNFSYAIPVPPGSYTVRLHFLESFFSPQIPLATCQGAGCRVFDVYCNGVALLQDFDIVQAASGAFRPVVREFHGLHPNGQGKLLLSFTPKANYAEVRGIEVVDEAK